MCYTDENDACSNRSWIDENNALHNVIMTEEDIKSTKGKRKT